MARGTSTRTSPSWRTSSRLICRTRPTSRSGQPRVRQGEVEHPGLVVLVRLPARVYALAVLAERAEEALREAGMVAPDPPLAPAQRHAVDALESTRVEVVHREAVAVIGADDGQRAREGRLGLG